MRLRLRSSSAPATLTSASLTIGGVTGAFNVTTAAAVPSADTTPDAFSFTAQAGLEGRVRSDLERKEPTQGRH